MDVNEGTPALSHHAGTGTRLTKQRAQRRIGIEVRQRAAQLLADGLTAEQTAVTLDVHPETIRGWRRNDAEVQQWLREAQAAHAEAARDRLIGLVNAAIGTLGEIMQDRTAPAAVRRACACDLLDRAGVRPRSEDQIRSDNADLEQMTPAELAAALEEAARNTRTKAAQTDSQSDKKPVVTHP